MAQSQVEKVNQLGQNHPQLKAGRNLFRRLYEHGSFGQYIQFRMMNLIFEGHHVHRMISPGFLAHDRDFVGRTPVLNCLAHGGGQIGELDFRISRLGRWNGDGQVGIKHTAIGPNKQWRKIDRVTERDFVKHTSFCTFFSNINNFRRAGLGADGVLNYRRQAAEAGAWRGKRNVVRRAGSSDGGGLWFRALTAGASGEERQREQTVEETESNHPSHSSCCHWVSKNTMGMMFVRASQRLASPSCFLQDIADFDFRARLPLAFIRRFHESKNLERLFRTDGSNAGLEKSDDLGD